MAGCGGGQVVVMMVSIFLIPFLFLIILIPFLFHLDLLFIFLLKIYSFMNCCVLGAHHCLVTETIYSLSNAASTAHAGSYRFHQGSVVLSVELVPGLGV